ncbi:MAG: hypothetical protein KDD66_10580 [Bdellovibrionales bacterium]|nr:hypothetical protein [Bdellovibrionales bacterium]
MNRFNRSKLDILGMMLLPALRFCLRRLISVHEIVETLKIVLIDLAGKEIQKAGGEITVSRISVMTGMNRREVSRILQDGKRIKDPDVDLTSRVTSTWEHDEEFLTQTKRPRVLSYKGRNSEFKRLCKKVSKDINPATMLFELLRRDSVEETPNGVKLRQGVSFHHEVPERGLELLTMDTDTLIRSVEENLLETKDQRNLHIRTEYDNIFIDDIPKVRRWIFERGQQFHKDLRDFLSNHDKDINNKPGKEGGGRVVVTAFSWTMPPD